MKEYNFNIPSSWNEITLEMFDGIALAEGNPYEKTIQILNVLTGLPEEELKNMPATALESANLTNKLLFLSKEPKKVMPQNKYKGLNATYDISLVPAKWTAAQYLDYTTVLTGNVTKKMARLIACFTIPEGHKYGDGYDFEQVVDDIYTTMPITVALGYSSFFQLQLTSYKKALSAYSERKKKRLTQRLVSRLCRKKQKEDSTQSGIPLS